MRTRIRASRWGIGAGGIFEDPKSARPFHLGVRRPRFMKGKPCRSIGKSFSKRRSKSAASLRGRRPTVRTEHFGSKLLGVGRNSFARPKKLNDAGGNSRSGLYARTLKRGTKLERGRLREAASCTSRAARGSGDGVAVPARC
jgi:hypothetical protein